MPQKPEILRVFWNVMPHSFLGKYYQPNPTNCLASNRARLDKAVMLLIRIQGAQVKSPPGHQQS